MTDPENNVDAFLKQASEVTHRAVGFDKSGNWRVAIYFYQEAIYLLQRVTETIPLDDPKTQLVKEKTAELSTRLSTLQKGLDDELKDDEKKKKTKDELILEKAYFLVAEAIEADEKSAPEAVELYENAVQMCLDAKKSLPPENQEMSTKLLKVAGQALERAEKIKGINSTNTSTSVSDIVPGDRNKASQPAPVASSTGFSEPQPAGPLYSDEEKKVLLQTSTINKIAYVPFLSVDLREKFTLLENFQDPNGLLKLSPKQRASFRRWARPDEVYSNPRMVDNVDSFTIKQTIVSDCSFVASLAIAANYEKRFKKRLITNIIYPQRAGMPILNPYGKYMVKLNINGVPRKIIIDDLLPTGSGGQLLCSYSGNKGELWVSLLEKAYMKVMGGYDFPGSNSNIDLHALTGWIPERLSVKELQDPQKTYKMLMQKMNEGQVLVTLATGDLDEKVAERAGLVPTHAYACLALVEVKGVQLLLLKNPWSHLRWRGNYSELDAVHWTEEMKRLLNYDPNSAQVFDNGVFWIDYASVRRFFDVFYMNWNPGMFQYTYCVHRTWISAAGPRKDVYNIGDNPQYSLEIKAGGKPAVVWALLTRHITDIDDFRENKEYITVLVYDTGGNKVYYPYDPPPIIDGVRINSPHYLCKIQLPKGTESPKRYTLVLSQYEKTTTIHYSLRCYSTTSFRLGEIKSSYLYKKKITGDWKGVTAGGCANHSTYSNNPTYRRTLNSEAKLLIDLKAMKEYQIGFDFICVNTTSESSQNSFYKKSTGPYRPGFVILELPNIPPGTYNIIPSTFLPQCEGPFFLHIQSTSQFDVQRL